ncbi:hypothetical protein EV363DRAFT_1324661, partial [Boletus edulis]
MIWATRIISLLALAASLSLSEAIELDVWVPRICYPNEYTVWQAGVRHNVTWDISDKPTNVTNYNGTIRLVTNGRINLGSALASGFNLTAARVEIIVPRVKDGEYQLVLMGDSGNYSPKFKIV